MDALRPDTVGIELDDSYARAVPGLSVAWRGAEVPDPQLVVINEALADELGLDREFLTSPAGIDLLVGQAPDGLRTTAQVYAGHQFGVYVPRLGDGRALLLGEVIDRHGYRRDLHLKGSGRTPFARAGDGKAVLGPMLREYITGESLHALGIPTTRGLAVVTTGEWIWRDHRKQPGAVLCRVAASHLRVGTFQYAAGTGDRELLRSLADYAIDRHHPQCVDADNPYLALLAAVVDAQAALIAQWMGVGFIHGVMNTDNTTISGESMDFGPCAFLDAFDPASVFSSIDASGRYAYGNQPAVAQWNLARFAETLLPLIDPDPQAAVEPATAVIISFADAYDRYYGRLIADKLGLPAPNREVVTEILTLLADQRVDFTRFFRALAAGTAGDLFADPAPFEAWLGRRRQVVHADEHLVAERMNRVNPVHIPATTSSRTRWPAPPAATWHRCTGWSPRFATRTSRVPSSPTSPSPHLPTRPRTSPTAAPERCPG